MPRNQHRTHRASTETVRDLTKYNATTITALQNQAQRLQAIETVSPGRSRLSVITTPLDINQTAIETEYASVVLPRGLLGTRNIFPIFSELFLYNTSGLTNSINFKIHYGSGIVSVGPIALAPLATQTTYRVCRIITKIIGDGSPNLQRVNTSLIVSAVGETLAGSNSIEDEFKSSLAVDSTQDQFVQLTVQHSDSTVLFRTVLNHVEFGFPIVAS